ncbi:WD40 repeat domain-containing protein [Thermocatellispora tengchongensis]|uniref:WD40 repeat domain-containing protein n=1 Tax=Thermocatellispora tengchongensis TaxID=1073253 RepID=UPI00362F3BE0
MADRAMVLRHAISASQPDLAFDPDGHSARVLDGDTVVTLDLTGLAGYARPRWSALAPGGRLLASWDPATGGVRLGEPLATGGGRHTGRTLGRKPSGAWSLSLTAFSPDGRALAAGGSDDDGTEIVVWDTGTGAEQARITGLPSPPDSVAFSPDGRRLVSVTSDVNRPVFLVDLWDLDSGERLWRVTRDLAREAAFTPDGRTVLVRGDDAMAFDVAAFDAATGEPRGPATLGGASRGVRFGSGGVLYAAGDAEGSLTMWVPGSPAPVEVTLRGSTRDIAGLAAAPVGGPLATVARDGTVAVWDRATGALLGRVSGPPVAITDLAFSADAARLLILDANGGLGVHRLRPGDAAAEVCARAGRGLSEKEWRAHLPGLPYREVCRL